MFSSSYKGRIVVMTVCGLLCTVKQPYASSNLDTSAYECEQVALDEAIGVLDDASSSCRANYDHIRTWSGRCLLFDSLIVSQLPPPAPNRPSERGVYLRRYETEIEFACNLTADLLNTRFKPNGPFIYEDLSSERRISADAKASDKWSILTPKNCLQFGPNEVNGRFKGDPTIPGWSASQSRVVRRQSTDFGKKFVSFGDVFDPRQLFASPGANLPYITFDLSADAVKTSTGGSEPGPKVALFRSRIEPAIYRLTSAYLVGSDHKPITLILDFSKDEAMCVVNAAALSGANRLWSCKMKYATINGAVIPSHYLYEQYDASSHNVKVRRQVEMKEQLINQPLDNDTLFSYKAFGLEPGDRVLDTLEDRTLMVGKNGELLPVAEFEEQYQPRFVGHSVNKLEVDSTSGNTRMYFILLNVAVIALMVLLLLKRLFNPVIRQRNSTVN